MTSSTLPTIMIFNASDTSGVIPQDAVQDEIFYAHNWENGLAPNDEIPTTAPRFVVLRILFTGDPFATTIRPAVEQTQHTVRISVVVQASGTRVVGNVSPKSSDEGWEL